MNLEPVIKRIEQPHLTEFASDHAKSRVCLDLSAPVTGRVYPVCLKRIDWPHLASVLDVR